MEYFVALCRIPNKFAVSNRHKFPGGNNMYRFLVIIEKGSQSYGAYSPDLLAVLL